MAKDARRNPTIYDIAQRTSASPATVSMVLNGKWEMYRISRETADRVLAAAASLGYRANLRARALRLARSGLVGMVLPHYRNRFFADLAENFEHQARRHDLCPMIVSTQRDPDLEDSVVRTLLAQQVEGLLVAGVKNPERLNTLCLEAQVPVVDIDLPGSNAPSVTSNNRSGAELLTKDILSRARLHQQKKGRFYFIGGDAADHATSERIAGFRAALRAARIPLERQEVRPCGFSPVQTKGVLQELLAVKGDLPAGLFINSITALEGLVDTIRAAGPRPFQQTAIGCNDWDPFGAMLPLDIVMMRQDAERIVEKGFEMLKCYTPDRSPLISIPPLFPGQMANSKRNVKAK